MNHIVSKLMIYGNMPEDSILMRLADIFHDMEERKTSKDELVTRVYNQVRRILEIGTEYGFDGNLWHNYLAFLLITTENPFSLTCEKEGSHDGGTVNDFAKNDFKVFKQLFDYKFAKIEEYLGIDCFTKLGNYKAIVKKELMYNRAVSEKVRMLSERLESANDENEFFDFVTGFYRDYGVGMFGLNKAFRIKENADGGIEFIPINNMESTMLSDLVGYETQKKKLIDNTKAFVEGRKANNVLLFGDSGTGKSASIKAIVNEFYGDGLRMIEIYKHQFKDLSAVISSVKSRNYKFIIYMDDLSFEEFEIEYKYLKAVIEGGVETKPDNILMYATSNRRHLIKETWSDRNDGEYDNGVHRSDTVEEKLSLFNRFGVTISYSKPNITEFMNIVKVLAEKSGVNVNEETLESEANKWQFSHGGVTSLSGRSAQQFINYLIGIYGSNK